MMAIESFFLSAREKSQGFNPQLFSLSNIFFWEGFFLSSWPYIFLGYESPISDNSFSEKKIVSFTIFARTWCWVVAEKYDRHNLSNVPTDHIQLWSKHPFLCVWTNISSRLVFIISWTAKKQLLLTLQNFLITLGSKY